MKNRTRKLQFSQKEKIKIFNRQNGQCLFCSIGYHMECQDEFGYAIADFMHYINKSAGGLGIEQNGVLGCRYHHTLLDNGNKGLREEMLQIMEKHLRMSYPGWNREELIYKKWK